MIPLSYWDLAAAAVAVVALAVANRMAGLGVSRQLLWLAARGSAQLLLLGLVLRFVLGSTDPLIVGFMALVMLAVAAREVKTRQVRPLAGRWGYLAGALAMFLSSFLFTVFALAVVLGPDPWWAPRFSIPLLGMLLGNTMNGVSLSTERLTEAVVRSRDVIEQRLALGETREQAVSDISRESVRAGLIPIFNAMAAAGVVSLPGMMTGTDPRRGPGGPGRPLPDPDSAADRGRNRFRGAGGRANGVPAALRRPPPAASRPPRELRNPRGDPRRYGILPGSRRTLPNEFPS